MSATRGASVGPAVVLENAELEVLELLTERLLAPVDGYRLPGEQVDGWPVTPTLRVRETDAAAARSAGRVELRDPDTTPIAVLSVTASAPAGDGYSWIAGQVRRVRRPEHGPARGHRIVRQTDFSRHAVVLFGGEVRPVDVLTAVDHAGGRPLDLVLEASTDPSASLRMLRSLEESAALLPSACAWFLPRVDLGAEADVVREVVSGRGAANVLDLRRSAERDVSGGVILLTGLSGSGKSTVARALADSLRTKWSRRVVLLDGDQLRAHLAPDLGFSAEDRDQNLQRQAWVAARVAEAGGLAICAPIAPFAATRAAMRAKVEPSWPFLVVHVATPLAVAEARDRKGLYAKARAGLITEFTGIDSPYEVPEDADLRVDTSTMTVSESVHAIERLLAERGLTGTG